MSLLGYNSSHWHQLLTHLTGITSTITGITSTITGITSTITGITSTITGITSTITGITSTITCLSNGELPPSNISKNSSKDYCLWQWHVIDQISVLIV